MQKLIPIGLNVRDYEHFKELNIKALFFVFFFPV